MVYRIEGIRLGLEADEHRVKQAAADILGVGEDLITGCLIIRKSIDARRNRPPAAIYIVNIETSARVPLSRETIGGVTVKAGHEEPYAPPDFSPAKRQSQPVIVGCGPAGLFAALTLVLQGIAPVLLERGKAVQERAADVAAFWRHGRLHPESHVQFGEGGAGTFSDGKLTSRTRNPLSGWVKKVFVDMGAPPHILTDGKPHIGTDCLRDVIINLRNFIMEKGCHVRFGAKMTDVLIRDGKIAGVVVNGREEIATDCLILAGGQSADDTYTLLHDRGVALEPKPFAMGLRVEHPQALINAIQYGTWANHPQLPPAEYFLTASAEKEGRSVYTFCMCPGGQVIGSSARTGGLVTNGMSRSLRNGLYANSAVVVNVRTDDFLDAAASPLSGLAFRRHWEERAFSLGGGDYRAPAEGVIDYMKGKTSPGVGETTFMPGVRPVSLCLALPPFIADAIKTGLTVFNEKMPGFISTEANLIGIETRTSSPVRITRGEDGQSVSLKGLYPCGEGAGYAGGIISSALDGIRAAQRAAAA